MVKNIRNTTSRFRNEEEEALWQMEERYWALFLQGDEKCLEMIGGDFLGWPHNAEKPTGKAGIPRTLAAYRARPVLPVLEPVGMSICGETAVVHLIRRLSAADEKDPSVSAVVRVLHTWIRREGEWRLLGGMGYPSTAR